MDKKEVLRAILWFAAAAAITTVLGNFVSPKIGAIAASFYSSAAEPDTRKKAETVVTATVISTTTTTTTTSTTAVTTTLIQSPVTQENVKQPGELPVPKEQPETPAAETAGSDTMQENQPAEKEPEIPRTDVPKSDQPTSAADSPGIAEAPKESPPENTVKKELSQDDISELEKAMKSGEVRELGEGRAAYKVKKGDTFSQICKKVFGTGTAWKEKAEKSNIDPRKIRPGKVLIFEKE